MKKLLISTILLGAVLTAGGLYLWDLYQQPVQEIVEELVVEENDGESKYILEESKGFTWYQDEAQEINVVTFEKPIDFYFTASEAQSLSEQALLHELELAVNGSYYIGSYVEADHSGLLQIRGQRISEYVPHVQISHVIRYNHQNGEIGFIRAKEFDPNLYGNSNFSLVQSGPLILEENQIQSDYISGSLNGSTPALRTLLGFTESGKTFVVTTRVAYTLTDLAIKILALDIFKDELISVINLDGGASTAMYSSEIEALNFRESVRLPLVIGVK